jgi:hypothetical protein
MLRFFYNVLIFFASAQTGLSLCGLNTCPRERASVRVDAKTNLFYFIFFRIRADKSGICTDRGDDTINRSLSL